MDNYLLWPRAIAAAITDTAFATAFGIALVCLWLPRPAPQLRRWLWACVAAMLITVPAQMYLMTASMIASAAFPMVRMLFATAIGETHAGRNLILQLAILIVLALLVAILRNQRQTTWLLPTLFLLAAARAASGHAASDGDFNLRELIQWVHLTSIATWAGALLAAGLFAVPTLLRDEQSHTILTLTRKLSKTVTVALTLVILSGIYNGYHGLAASLAPLRNTQWGLLLDAKTLLVLAAVLLGYLNRRSLRPQADFTAQQATRLTKLLRAEAILMLLILTLSAFLANSPPADMSSMAM
jgi:putative copper resistance protein D